MRSTAVVTIAVALLVAACGGSAPAASSGAGVAGTAAPASGNGGGNANGALRVQLPAAASARFAGYYAAVEQGYFGEAGLEVELVPGLGEQEALREVASGDAPLGVSPMMRVMRAQEDGAKLVMVGQIMQRSGVSIVASKASKISDARSMKGRKVGVRSDGTEAEVRQAIKKAGLDDRKDVTISLITDVSALLSGELDAVQVVSYDDLATVYERAAASGTRLTPADVTVFDFNSDFVQTAMIPDGIVANTDWLGQAGNEDRVVAFLVATGRGWAWCRDNQDACAALSRKHGAAGGPSHEAFVLNETLALIWPAFTGIGEIDRALWALTARTALAAGRIEREPAEGAYRIDLAERATDQLDTLGVDKRGRQWEKLELVPNEGGA